MFYINNFFIYSILGFVYECIICILFNNNIESGFMYGPYTPIYGIGILIILFIYNKLKFNKEYKKGIMLFVFSFIILTIIEYIGGVTIKFIFKDIYWDYSKLPLHIGKYISLEISILWGFSSLIYIYILKPITNKLAIFLPKYITYILCFIFIIDLIISIITKQKLIKI